MGHVVLLSSACSAATANLGVSTIKSIVGGLCFVFELDLLRFLMFSRYLSRRTVQVSTYIIMEGSQPSFLHNNPRHTDAIPKLCLAIRYSSIVITQHLSRLLHVSLIPGITRRVNRANSFNLWLWMQIDRISIYIGWEATSSNRLHEYVNDLRCLA